jgi:hypothetical protein
MCRKLIYLILFLSVLGIAEGQVREWDRAAYWDGRYPSAWGGGGEGMRDALQAAGYKILNADQLKTWMDGHIADKALSVVVFCRDVVPDTVAESMSNTCTLRKYLDAGGKVVWYSDWPIYYQGSSDGSMVTWGGAGATSVLGFNASSGPNDTYDEVVFTDEGIAWGLTQTWQSQRSTSITITENLTPLATISSGSAAAWAKHYLPGDKYRGFVRIFDRTGAPDNADDIIRIAEYMATKSGNPSPADGGIHPDTWVSISWGPGAYAASHDVYFSDNFDAVNDGTAEAFYGNQPSTYFTVGFPGFPYPDGLVPGTTYYWRIDDVEQDGVTKHRGSIWSFMIPPKTAYAPKPANGAELVAPDVKLSWAGGFGSKLHYVYFGDNFDDVNNAAGGPPAGAATYTPPGPLKLAKTYYWRVDEFDIMKTYKGDVWSFTTQGAVGSPNPSNGAVDVKQTQILTWSPGDYAASHQLYFGTDKEVVRKANTSSPEYKGTRNLGSESYDPGKLQWDTTYYWRIDEVDNANPDSPWTGPLWSFTTANFLIVDDFEDYDVGNNEIWWAWKDGLGYAAHGNEPAYPGNGTGSMVGDETTGSYCEETIIHGGSQSMPLFYDNSILRYSEAEKTLTYPRDWTENGVNMLTIWFRGISANTAETLYVALNGNAVVSHDNPNAAQIDKWTRWNIDLQAFADQGVNLTNVNTIALGLGNKKNPVAGGSGTMYFDDIRLYPPAP